LRDQDSDDDGSPTFELFKPYAHHPDDFGDHAEVVGRSRVPGNVVELKARLKRGRVMDGRRLILWVEASLTAVTTVALLMTLVLPSWIEVVFDADPDAGDGSAERWLTATLLVATVAFAGLTGRSWAKLRAAT
jgi:hypothetical protein